MPRQTASRLFLTYLAIVACFASITGVAEAVTPKDPQVKEVIEKAITFLEGNKSADANSNKLGGHCLSAMAILKHRKNVQHPIVQSAIQACQAVAANPSAPQSTDFNYSLGIAILFMCEVDELGGKQYSNEIKTLLQMMASRQRQDGAWSYPNHPTGDTSQTQYGALSAWRASIQGYEPSLPAIDEYCNWLIRTQDPSGQFAYQGTDPGHYNRAAQQSRTDQPDAAFRMSPAALGALYIGARLREIPMAPASQEKALFTKVGETKSTIDENLLRRAIRDGNQQYDASFKIDVNNNYQFYYLYSVERYFTLRYDAEGEEPAEPAWYNQGFDYLSKKQADNGSWADQTGATTSTAFGALFLMRATRQILDLEGVVRGGYGLPADLTNVREVDGQVVSNEAANDLVGVMQLISEGGVLEETTITNVIDEVTLGGERKQEPSQVENLKKLIAGQDAGRNYVARMAAVRAIANAGDIANAPVLIYALGDGDHRVVREANNGLRLLSKRLSLVKLPEQPSLEQKRAAQNTWYEWLKSVRPDLEVPEDAFLELTSTK